MRSLLACGDDAREIARDLLIGQRESRLTYGHLEFRVSR